jgi:hypothetical protein
MGSQVDAITQWVKQQNDKKNFVTQTVKQIGYPRWDKAVIKSPQSKLGGRGNSGDSSIYVYVPFVRDSQHYVNASMIVEINGDTTIRYVCDWQYQERVHGPITIDTTAERLAYFFMRFDYITFGHKKFALTDSTLFATGLHQGSSRNIGFSVHATGGRGGMLETTTCVDYYICGTPDAMECWWGCDYLACPSGECYLVSSECSSDFPHPGDGPVGTPETGGGGSGGGTGSSTPPDCGGGPTTGNRGATNVPCGPGWTPVPENPPPPPEPIDSMLKRYSTKINTIADSIFAISQNSNEEWGFIIVENAAGEIYAKACTTNHDAGQVRLDRSLSTGERIIAELHTHPEVGPNPLSRSAPSGSDFKTLKINSRYPYTSFIDCGNVRYAIVVENVDLSRTFFQKPENRIDILTANQDSIAQTKPNWSTDWQNATEVSILELIGSSAISGIGVYKSDTTKTTFIKLN